MPWICGIFGLVIYSVGVCLILELFEIDNKCLQIILGILILSFPAIGSIFVYIFAVPVYSIAFLYAILSVYCAVKVKHTKYALLLSSLFLVLSLGTYQLYFFVASGLFLIYLCKELLCNIEFKYFRNGFKYLGILIFSLICYLLLFKLLCILLQVEPNSYFIRVTKLNNIKISNIIGSLLLFNLVVLEGYAGLVSSVMNGFLCIVLLFFIWMSCFYILKKMGRKRAVYLEIVLTIFFYGINASLIELILSHVQTRFFLVYVTFYILVVLIINTLIKYYPLEIVKVLKVLFYTVLIVIAKDNICEVNRYYMCVQQSNIIVNNFYTNLVNNIIENESYTENKTVLLIGELHKNNNFITSSDLYAYYDTKQGNVGKGILSDGLGSSYITEATYNEFQFDKESDIITPSCERQIQLITGVNMKMGLNSEKVIVQDTEEFKQMSVYPENSSIKEINGYIVVKLSE